MCIRDRFWDAHSDEYAWKTRVDGQIFRCADVASAERILAVAQEEGGDVETMRREMVSENPLSITDFKEVDGMVQFVRIRSVEAPTGKTLDEARGKVIADFQDHLETSWLAELRARYPYEVDRTVLHAIR